MGAGSGGADAVRMINRQAREAARYRQERRERRASMKGESTAFGTGEVAPCSMCGEEWDHDFLLRIDEAWVCELCNATEEAEVEVNHDHGSVAGLLAGFIGATALYGTLALEPTTAFGPFMAWTVVCVVSGTGLLAWARALTRSGYDSLGLRAATWVGLPTLLAPGALYTLNPFG